MDESISRNGHSAEGRCGERPIKVLKFGGSSLVTAARLSRVVDIVRDASRTHRLVVVVSAIGKTTDGLVAVVESGASLDGIREAHREHGSNSLTGEGAREYEAVVERVLAGLPASDRSPATRDLILSAGERLSVPLVSLLLREAGLRATPVDAASLIRTDDTFGAAQVDLEETMRQIRSWHATLDNDVIAVVTGFIGSTVDGDVTTLGRGGSDYTAALLAWALKAEALERWTDVDGLYTTDPRKNGRARKLASIDLSDAVAWNRAGRLGMHTSALDPILAAAIPVYVRSTLIPEHGGTVINPDG